MRDRIYITEADAERLRRLVESLAAGSNDRKHLDMLEQELDRAEIVPSSRFLGTSSR